ncbi:hypothetical protein [Thermococcus sp.]
MLGSVRVFLRRVRLWLFMRWFAEAGTHSYRITAYSSRLGGEAASSLGTFIGTGASAPRVDGGSTSNSINGTIRVSHNYQIFGAALKVFPREVAGGGTVYFTAEVRNYESEALSLVGFVEDEEGAVIKRIDGFEGRIPANGEKNITFSYKVYSVGEHTFKLFLDNYDGKPNGYGAENWSKTTVEVKPVNGTELKQVEFECNDLYLSTGLDKEHHLLYKGTLTCKAILYNPAQYSLRGNITDVYAVEIIPKVFDDDLVGEWRYTPIINVAPKGYYTVLFQRNTTTLNVYDLENDLYGLTFTMELHYEFKGPFNEEFIGVGSAQVTQNSVQAAISGAIFVGGTVATAVGFVISAPALTAMGTVSSFVGLLSNGRVVRMNFSDMWVIQCTMM